MADLQTADIVTAVRNKLADDQFSQTLIIDAINFFVAEIYHNTRTRRMETNDTVSVAVNDTVADLPDDIDVRINAAVTVPTTNIYDMEQFYMEYGDFMKRYPGWKTYPAQAIYNWTDFGNQIRFCAPVLTASTIDIDYTRKPVQALLVADSVIPTDTIELDESYKELATLGALARCMESNEDYAEATSERGNLQPLLTSWIRNEARGGAKTGPIIMRSNRNTTTSNRNRDW